MRTYELTHDMTEEFIELHAHPRTCDCPQCSGDGEDWRQNTMNAYKVKYTTKDVYGHEFTINTVVNIHGTSDNDADLFDTVWLVLAERHANDPAIKDIKIEEVKPHG